MTVSNRKVRQAVFGHHKAITEQLAPAVQAALTNEQKTRQRVEMLEQRADALERGQGTFWGRLRRLAVGR